VLSDFAAWCDGDATIRHGDVSSSSRLTYHTRSLSLCRNHWSSRRHSSSVRDLSHLSRARAYLVVEAAWQLAEVQVQAVITQECLECRRTIVTITSILKGCVTFNCKLKLTDDGARLHHCVTMHSWIWTQTVPVTILVMMTMSFYY